MDKIKNSRLVEESKIFSLATPIILIANYFIFYGIIDLNSIYLNQYTILTLIISTTFLILNISKTDLSKKYIYNSIKNLFFIYLIYSPFISISSIYFIKKNNNNISHKIFLITYVGSIILTAIYNYIKTRNSYESGTFFKMNISETEEYLLMNGKPQFQTQKDYSHSEISKKLKSMIFSIVLPVSTMAYPLQKLIANQYGDEAIFLFLAILGFFLHVYVAKGFGYYLFSNIVIPLKISKQHGKPIYFHKNF